MKKDKLKSNKRTIREDIKLSLITELKALTGRFADASVKLDKEINRSAKKLAKRISKGIKIEEVVISAPAQGIIVINEVPKPKGIVINDAAKPKPKDIVINDAVKPKDKKVKVKDAQ